MKTNRIIILLVCCALISCEASKKIVYMQNAQVVTDTTTANKGIVIQPKDILTIVVSSRTATLAVDFNLPLMSYQAGSSNLSTSYSQRLLGYLVDSEGEIDFPQFGRLKVEGMTRDQLSNMIKQKIVSDGIIKDAIVTTEFMNFKISVLGEVRVPGVFSVGDDRITILEALGRAGDMTIYGRRDNVLVTRENNGETVHYRIDLTSTDFIHSPVYYLKQNDVIYVQPNNTVAARSRINENRTLGVGFSLVSVISNLVLLYFTLK